MLPLFDFVLNLAGLLLWLLWRSAGFDPLRRTSASSLVGTLKRAEPRRWKSWHGPLSLIGLLAARALAYWQIGPGANWVPKLDLMVVVLAFRPDTFLSALVFSFLSFGRILLLFYLWLLMLTVLNRGTTDPDPFLKIIRQHLGGVARWPWPIQLTLPLLAAAALWFGFHPLLIHIGVTNHVRTNGHLLEQAFLVGVGFYFSLKYLLPVLLVAHLVATYVYFGNSPIWDFIATTSRKLLTPLRRLPLCYGKCDFAPLVGAVLLLLLLHWLPNWLLYGLPVLASRLGWVPKGAAIWPQ